MDHPLSTAKTVRTKISRTLTFNVGETFVHGLPAG